MGITDTEEKLDKWYRRLRKETSTIFLALSISLNIWLNMQQQKAQKEAREDLAAKDRVIAQKDAELKESNRERDVAQNKAIEAQSVTIQLLAGRPRDTSRN